jgi:hypothetical protein
VYRCNATANWISEQQRQAVSSSNTTCSTRAVTNQGVCSHPSHAAQWCVGIDFNDIGAVHLLNVVQIHR